LSHLPLKFEKVFHYYAFSSLILNGELGRVGLGVLEEKEQEEIYTQVKRQRIENKFKQRRRSAFDDKKLQKQLTDCTNISQQLDEAKKIPLENNTVLREYDTHKIDESGEEMKIGAWVRTLTMDDVSVRSIASFE